jgi:hypothetical protein
VFHIILRINSSYFPTEQWITAHFNGNAVCSLWSTKITSNFIMYINKFQCARNPRIYCLYYAMWHRFQRTHCYFSSPELNKDGNQGSEMAEITHKQFLSRNILQVRNKTNFSLVMLRLTTLGWGWFVSSNIPPPAIHYQWTEFVWWNMNVMCC